MLSIPYLYGYLKINKMKKNLLLITVLMLVSLLGFKANSQVTCGSDSYLEEQLRVNLELKNNLINFERIWQEKQEILMSTANRMVITGIDTIYEIPVVFQVIHTGSAIGTHYNPSMTKIQGVIDYLNQVYGATYAPYPGVGSGGVNIPIRFVLAKRDPSCNATDGINRINANSVLSGTNLTDYINYGVKRNTNGISDATLKGIVQWDPSLYYNIWVVNKIDGWDGYGPGSGVVGYAQFAGGTASSDGTVIMESFNAAGQSTLPHELGHAFNLYHTFQGGCLAPATNPCATTGDRVCDTEPQAQSFNCETGNTPCGTPWSPTIKNVMGYSSCTDKRFTLGQRERIIAALLTQRGSLIMSIGGVAPGSQTTYPQPVALSGCANPGITNAGNTTDMGPSSVKIADLQYFSYGYTNDGNQQYINRNVPTCGLAAAPPANMIAGQSYPVEIGTGYNPENVRIWIDFNNDGTFTSPAELVFSSNGVAGDHNRIHTGNTMLIPTTADTSIPLRMRVVSDYYTNSNPSSCGGNLQYGQTEDFSVKLTKAPVPTPVPLKSINAKVATDKKSINVNWEPGIENNVEEYVIERSLDGKEFYKIARLNSKGSNTVYNYNDAEPSFNVTNYYRVKIMGPENSFTYSTVVSALVNTKNDLAKDELRIYPNPVENLLNVVASHTGAFDVTVNNALGQEVYSIKGLEVQAGVSAIIDLKLVSLNSGVYNLFFVSRDGLSLSGKFVKK